MTALATVGADEPDAAARLKKVALAWIGMAGDPVIQGVILLDGPSVLGLERLDNHMVLGAMDEMAIVVARAADSAVAVAESAPAVEELLNRVLRA